MRGIYVLYQYRPRVNHYDVVYVGMAAKGGIRPRLRSHKRKKEGLWTHCSVFEVWDNISVAEQVVYAATYESHASFVLASASQKVLDEALALLIKRSQLPTSRLACWRGLSQNNAMQRIANKPGSR